MSPVSFRIVRLVSVAALACAVPLALAQQVDRIDDTQLPAVPPPPPEIQAMEEDGAPPPAVTIRETERGTETEYRVNGRLYKVQIVPETGAPYYLLDKDGDGIMEFHSLNDPGPSVPMWVIGTF
ncbi:MAG: DUF2782 domain-containing protein [Zoogloeaceae bacterium]|jgi:hypothetical protein|nr:DUF2782 domain-containing protein [Zoogloeaceae bacterium]